MVQIQNHDGQMDVVLSNGERLNLGRSPIEHYESGDAYIRRDWMMTDRFYREQIENGERPSLHISYRPTDWTKSTKAEERELMDGWDESNGYCSECFMLRSKTGRCNCE